MSTLRLIRDSNADFRFAARLASALASAVESEIVRLRVGRGSNPSASVGSSGRFITHCCCWFPVSKRCPIVLIGKFVAIASPAHSATKKVRIGVDSLLLLFVVSEAHRSVESIFYSIEAFAFSFVISVANKSGIVEKRSFVSLCHMYFVNPVILYIPWKNLRECFFAEHASTCFGRIRGEPTHHECRKQF